MYDTTENYKELIKRSSRNFDCRITIGDRVFNNDNLINMKISDNIQPTDKFMIGTTTSNTLEINLLNVGRVYSINQVKVEIGLKIQDNIEYVLMGYFNIDDIEENEYTSKIIAYDNMIKTETPYFNDSGDELSVRQILNKISEITGVEFIGNVPEYRLKNIQGFTCREMLAYISAICGGYAVITREGKLTIKKLQKVEYNITPDNYIKFSKEKDKYKISKISCQVEDKIISTGSLSSDSMELQFENPLMTETILNDLYNEYNGFEYNGYFIKWQGDLSLDVGDIIKVTDVNSNNKTEILILSQTFTYNGGLTSEISAKSESKVKNSFNSKGSMNNKVNRVVTDLIIANEALINKANISDLKATNAEILNLKVKDAEMEHALINKANIEHLNSTNANVEKLIANDAIINEALISKADITELNAAKGKIEILESESAKIGVLEGNVANIQDVISGNLSSENIQTGGITGDNLNMSTINIADANIINVNANKINAGEIDTSKVKVKSKDGAIEIAGATQQFRDKNNKVRIQMGKDTQDNFNFILKGEDGITTLIDHTGIKESAIADNLIKENMVSENAIGEKAINYNSFATGFNKDTNTNTLKATKVILDNQNQSLELAFNNLKTQSEDTKKRTESNTTQIKVEQGKISSLIQDTTIDKDGQSLKLKDEYNRTVHTVDSMKNTISDHTTKIDQNIGKITGVESKTNVLERDLNSMSSKLSVTETKINEKIDSLEIGSSNFILNSAFTDDSLLYETDGDIEINNGIAIVKNASNFKLKLGTAFGSLKRGNDVCLSAISTIINSDLIPLNKSIGGNINVYSTEYDYIVDSIRKLKLNLITIPVAVTISDVNSNNPYIEDWALNRTKEYLNRLNSSGLITNNTRLIFEPHPLINGGISETSYNPSDKTIFFEKWKKIIVNSLSELKEYDFYGIYVGTNFQQFDNGAENVKHWSKLCNDIKKLYKNHKLIYRTNWWITAPWDNSLMKAYQDKVNNPIWESVDIISIAAYFELNDKAVPTTDELYNNIMDGTTVYNRGQKVYEEVKGFYDRWNKPIMFGELGCPSKEYGSQNPWSNLSSNNNSEDVQANFFEAYNRAFIYKNEEYDNSWFLGYSIFTLGTPTTEFNVVGKKAESKILNSIDFVNSNSEKNVSCYIRNKDSNNTIVDFSLPLGIDMNLVCNTAKKLIFDGVDNGELIFNLNRSSILKLSKPMLTTGTKTVVWSPSPQDNEGYINSKITETNSKISEIDMKTNQINLSVKENQSKIIAVNETMSINLENALNHSNLVSEQAKTEAINAAKIDATDKSNDAKNQAINTAAIDAQNKANKALNDARAFTNLEVNKIVTSTNSKFAEIKTTTDSITQSVNNTKTEVTNLIANVNNIEVGGRNLWLNTGFTNGTHNFYAYKANLNVIDEETSKSGKALEVISTGGGVYQKYGNQDNATPFREGEKLILSGYFKCTSTANLNISLEMTLYNKNIKPNKKNTWEYFEFEAVGNGIAHTFTLYGVDGNIYTFKELQLEKGTKATAWCPAPEDTTQEIINVTTEKVNQAKAEIKTTTDSISSKVSQVENTTTTINNKVTQNENRIANAENKITPNSITSTVLNSQQYKDDKGNIYTKEQTDSKIEQKANSIKQEVSTAGGGNLISNSGFESDLDSWHRYYYEWENVNDMSLEVWRDGNEWVLEGTKNICVRCSTSEESGEYGVEQIIKTKKFQDYTFTCLVAEHRADSLMFFSDVNWDWLCDERIYENQGFTGGKDIRKWKKVTLKFNSGDRSFVRLRMSMTRSEINGHVWFCQPMMNEGTIAQSWSEKAASSAYVAQHLSPSAIVNKISERLSDGGSIIGVATVIDKDKFMVKDSQGGSCIIDNGALYLKNGNNIPMISLENRMLKCYNRQGNANVEGWVQSLLSNDNTGGIGLFAAPGYGQKVDLAVLRTLNSGDPFDLLFRGKVGRIDIYQYTVFQSSMYVHEGIIAKEFVRHNSINRYSRNLKKVSRTEIENLIVIEVDGKYEIFNKKDKILEEKSNIFGSDKVTLEDSYTEEKRRHDFNTIDIYQLCCQLTHEVQQLRNEIKLIKTEMKTR